MRVYKKTDIVYPHKTGCSCFRCSGVVWNKGLKGIHLNPKNEIKKGQHLSPSTEIKKGQRLSPDTEFKRQGKNLSYFGIHSWVYRKFGKATKCEDCGSIFNIDWANISGNYLENRIDWKQLCGKCHHKFDRISEKIWSSRRKNNTVKWKEVMQH